MNWVWKAVVGLFLVVPLSIPGALCGCAKHEAQATAAPPKPAGPVLKPAPATPIDTKKVELGGDTWD